MNRKENSHGFEMKKINSKRNRNKSRSRSKRKE